MRKQERDHAKLKKKHELLQRERDLLVREKDQIQRTNDILVAEHGHLLEERHAGNDGLSFAIVTATNSSHMQGIVVNSFCLIIRQSHDQQIG